MSYVVHFEALRILAALLAAGGIWWGYFLHDPFMDHVRHADSFNDLLGLLIFAPGYLITAGYLIRCLSKPSLAWRRVIWGASALIQGAWLIFLLWATAARQGFFGNLDLVGELIFGGWWAFAFTSSVYGLAVESRKRFAQPHAELNC
jgi:hypothetical protein